MVALARERWRAGRSGVSTPTPRCRAWRPSVLRKSDELDAAERGHDEYLAVVGSHGSWATVSVAWARGELAYLRGDVAEAEAEARTAVEIARQAGFPLAFPAWLALLVEVLVERDELTAAEAELDGGRDGTGRCPRRWWFGPLLFSRARLRLARGSRGRRSKT